MTAPLNTRQELFAQGLADGKCVDEAAEESGTGLIRAGKLTADHYVYLLVDPRDGSPFYVGKGQQRRWAQHVKDVRNGRCANLGKYRRIQEILAASAEIDVFVLGQGMSERRALSLERAYIQAIGRKLLTNLVSGQQSAAARLLPRVEQNVLRMIPFQDWAMTAPRSNADIRLFCEVTRLFRKLYARLLSELQQEQETCRGS